MVASRLALAFSCAVSIPGAFGLQLSSSVSQNDVCQPAVGCCPTTQPLSDHPPEVPIKLVLASGCSGSTAVMKVAEGLHKRAGMPIADCFQRRELLTDLVEGHYPVAVAEANLEDGLKQVVEANSRRGLSLLFKDQSHYVMDSALNGGKLAEYITSTGKATVFIRENLIDLLLCSIRDGFKLEGATVGACPTCGDFRGRGEKEVSSEQAKISITANSFMPALWDLFRHQAQKVLFVQGERNILRRYLDQLELSQLSQSRQHVNLTSDEELGVGVDALIEAAERAITFEDLFAFESSTGAIDRSASAWTRLMASMGSTVGQDMVKSYLQEQESRPSPVPHGALISNPEDVKKEIEVCHHKYDSRFCDKVKQMWRGN